MKQIIRLAAAVGLCITMTMNADARVRSISPNGTFSGTASYLEPRAESPMYKFPVRPSESLLNYSRPPQLPAAETPRTQTPVMRAPEDINLLGFVPSGVGSYYGYMYNIPYRQGGTLTQASTMMVSNSWGGVEVNGIYYTTYQIAYGTMGYNYLNGYDTKTWMSTKMTSLPDFSMFSTALAKDPATDEVYGCFIDADYTKYEFGVADFANATRTTICDIDPTNPWAGAAMDANGTMYVVDVKGVLHTVNKQTGELTMVGDTGVKTTYFTAMCYDAKKNRLLRTICTDTGAGLYQIDPSTAECTQLTAFPNREQVLGLFIGAPLADDAAPEAPADVTADFPEGNLSGTVSFTIPAVTFGGQAAEGEVNWQVYGFYQTLASGTAQCGETVNAAVTVPYAGNATFQVTLSNAAGASPKSSVSCYIGKGTPTIPVPYHTLSGNEVTLTWAPVTTTVDGGYLNPADVTYSITRYPDNVQVAQHISETTFTDRLPDVKGLRYYQYNVVAENGDKMSGYGSSLRITIGSAEVPYTMNFSSYDSTQFYTIVDGNQDGIIWMVGAGGVSIINYSGDIAMDDWLITPGIELQAGHDYYTEMTFRSLQQAGEHADIEILYGTSPSPAAMTNVLTPRTNITELAKEPVKNMFHADADGLYYIAIHAIADNANWPQICTMIVKDGAMPGTVTDLTITPQPYPAVAADLKFNAPAKTAAGKPLSSISKIEIVRGGMVVKTFDQVTPGQTIEWEDVIGTGSWASGDYMWTITAFNDEAGEGLPATMIETVGLTQPGVPEVISAVETGDSGLVTLRWSHVDCDIKGRPLAPEYIKYRILNGSEYVDNAPEITTDANNFDTYSYQVVPEGEQSFAMMGVQLYNDRSSSVAFTAVMPVGAPYSTYKESFADGQPDHTIASIASEKFGFWQPVVEGYYEGYYSVDQDGGLIVLPGSEPGVSGTMSLGKFNLAGMEKPVISLNVMNVWGEEHPYSENSIDVLVDCGAGFELAGTISCDIHDQCDPGRYAKKSVDLSKYVGKGNISIAIRGTIVNYTIIAIDNIRVMPTVDNNLSMVNITAMPSVRAGQNAAVNVMYENNGIKTAEGYTVTLCRDGQDAITLDGAALEPGKMATVTFSDPVSVLSNTSLTYTARIDFAADQDQSDNATDKTAAVEVVMPKHPVPANLDAKAGEDGTVTLTWEAPVVANIADPIVEGFEDGEYGNVADSYGEWTFVDRDGAITDYQIRMAYLIFEPDATYLSYNPDAAPYNGNRYLSAWVNPDGTTNDDWAISPELSGTAQTISFYARSMWDYDGGESFRFLYSTGSLNPDDFVELAAEDFIPMVWKQYSYELPEGARFFAIRCVSEYQYMLLIDDVEYIPAGSGAGLELTGYNVYRNGELVNTDKTVPETSFVDMPQPGAEHKYVVTAMYDAGESAASNHATVYVGSSAADSVSAAGASVYGLTGRIAVIGAAGSTITVAGVDGRILATAQGTGRNTFAVAAGCYIVTVGDAVTKVIVK